MGFAAAAAILVAVGGAVLAETYRYRRDTEELALSLRVISAIETIHADVLQGVSSQRSYQLTDETAYRDLHGAALERTRLSLADLQALVAGDPAQAPRAQAFTDLVERRMELTREAIRRYERDGLDAARAFARGNGSLESTLDIEALSQAMRRGEEDRVRRRQNAANRSARRLILLGAVGVPVSLGILIAIYVLLSREVRERARAEATAQRLNDELSRHVQDLERAGTELRELSRYAGLLQSCLSVDEALAMTCRTLQMLLPHAAGSVYLLRASQDFAQAEAGWGEHAVAAPPMLMPQECWALRRNQPHAVDDVQTGLVCQHAPAPASGSPASTLCLPLNAQGMNLGFLYLSAPGRASLPGASVATAAEQLSLALSNLRLQETLRHQSIRDPLTGLFNRRYLEESLPRELARCERLKRPLALMMIDLDHFKKFNDTHGHDGGDALLTAFGKLLLGLCRREDIPCRYGGEEFTVILSDIDPQDALRRAEHLREAVSQMAVFHLKRELGRVTASIGIAIYPQHAHDGAELQRLADLALYRAKQAGRNRVEVAETPARVAPAAQGCAASVSS